MYRELKEEDALLLKEEIEKDPIHSKDKNFNASVFFDPKSKSIIFEDNEGIVMFVNLRRELRITIQFRDGIKPQRVRDVFERYIENFAKAFKESGYTAMTYTTECKPLAWFLRHFGFRKEETQRKVL